ncbi:acyl-CoA dehydrogenase family protein [Nocardioides marmorisolisilvae]|uniref:Acyl-CoA dehydrogenase n=1 Tax=Nocardioides marmorisolisilvae TaxID=1542737 RepID=A0A3N0DUS6_9ACTN|nr:acyl-CoA dehydrogenase family protein [Nocardioides marmorisolisilvae]RNL79382.1 acyl-CoA dehydrogenase [Nocardioides marmorisolisilvae]
MANPVKSVLAAGGKHGLSENERRDPIGLAVIALNKLAQSDVLDRLKIRKTSEQTVFRVTSAGFKTASAAGRAFARAGGAGGGKRVPSAKNTGLFDLTPGEDEQMLVDVVTEFATEVVRPAAAEANEACAAPEDLLKASLEIGLPILGVSEELGGIAAERSAVAGVLVHEALSQGDMGLAVASLASGAVATALSLYGSDAQQSTYLPAFAGDEVPAAALVLAEPTALFDPLTPSTQATRSGNGFVLNGEKSGVVRGAEAELFIIGAELDGKPQLFLVESSTPGITVVSDPSMGVRAAGLTRLVLKDVALEDVALFGDAATYREVVQNSRLAWCALAIGTGQAVLDYVTPYVKERSAFGEPIAHRQSVAFMVANIAIELQGMRLLTYKAASRVAQGKDASREIALARRICAERGMGIGNDGVQLLGGHGFVKEHPVERWYRDLRAIGLMEGAVLV